MTGRLLGIAVPLAILTSALLLALGRAARVIHTWWTRGYDDALDDNTRRHKLAYALLRPDLTAYALYLRATTRRTRSSR